MSSFTCPRCKATSHHPVDVREGYCGRCHGWTRDCPPGCDLDLPHWHDEAQPFRRIEEMRRIVDETRRLDNLDFREDEL